MCDIFSDPIWRSRTRYVSGLVAEGLSVRKSLKINRLIYASVRNN